MLRIATIVLFIVSLFANGCTSRPGGSDEDIVQWLEGQPREDIRKIPRVREFLAKHKIYISMTTSPKRIGKIVYVLKTLNLDVVEKIFVALPQKYRDTDAYVIPEELKNFPKVEILQGGEDLGPIMKLLPATKSVKALGDANAIVVTVDDDTGYHPDLLGQLIKNAIIYDVAIGSKGVNIDFWNISREIWPQGTDSRPGCYSGFDVSYCDVFEGYGSIAYPVKWVDVELLTLLSKVSKACKTSDDYVISFGLAWSGAPRALLTNTSFGDGIFQFAYGFEEDALHRGSGFLEAASSGSSLVARYQQCARDLDSWTKTLPH